MPKVIDNEDGTKTFTVNSDELLAVRDYIENQVPDVKKVLETVEGPWIRKSIDFIRSVVN